MSMHISLSNIEGNYGKQQILHSQMSILESIKRLNNYQKLRRKELTLKKKYLTKLKQLKTQLKEFEKQIPKVDLPKSFKQESNPENNRINIELEQIKHQLEKLNKPNH